MTRSLKKGPFVDKDLLEITDKVNVGERNIVIKTWRRRSTIIPKFIGYTFGVYNGKKHIPVYITEEMVGKKLGDYSPTRTYYGHGADKKAKRK